MKKSMIVLLISMLLILIVGCSKDINQLMKSGNFQAAYNIADDKNYVKNINKLAYVIKSENFNEDSKYNINFSYIVTDETSKNIYNTKYVVSLGNVNKLGNKGIEIVVLFDKDGKRLGYTNSNMVSNIPSDVQIDASNYSQAVKNVNLAFGTKYSSNYYTADSAEYISVALDHILLYSMICKADKDMREFNLDVNGCDILAELINSGKIREVEIIK